MVLNAEEFALRRADAGDLPALLQLLHEYFSEGAVQQEENERTLLPQLHAAALGFFVAEGPGGLAGWVLCRELESREGAAECKRLYVRSQFRGQGIAGRLMELAEAEAAAAGFAWLYLDSKENFQVAIAMYRRRGYVECSRFNDNREATIFLRKRLD